MESSARSLAALHFRPFVGLPEALDRLTKDLPRSPIMSHPPRSTPVHHLLYLDIILQYFGIFHKLMRVTLESSMRPTERASTPIASVAPTTVVFVNQWTRMPVVSAAPPLVRPAPVAPTPHSASIWQVSSSPDPPVSVGPCNRAWLSYLLSKLHFHLHPLTGGVSQTMQMSTTYRKLCDEYTRLLATMGDESLQVRFTLTGTGRS
jgi:hypothetical protein